MDNTTKAQDFLDGFKGADGVSGNPFSEQLELNLVAGIAGLLKKSNDDLLAEDEIYDIEDDKENRAEETGLVVVLPNKHQLQIDIDSDEAWDRLCSQLNSMSYAIQCELAFTSVTPSASGGPHRHAIITLPWEIKTEWERVALQFALCSDFKRECLGAFRLAAGLKDVTCFFEKPQEDVDESS